MTEQVVTARVTAHAHSLETTPADQRQSGIGDRAQSTRVVSRESVYDVT